MKRMKLSRLLVSSALVGASMIAVSTISSGAAPLTTVRVLIQAGNLQDTPMFVAQAEGFAAKAGLSLDLIVSTQPLTPLLSDSADISLITGNLAITGAQAGYAIKVAGVMTDAQWAYVITNNSLSVPKDSYPATFQALKGDIAGTTVLGGGSDEEMAVAMALAGVGNNWQDEALGTAAAMGAGIDANTVNFELATQPEATTATAAGAGAKVVFNFVTDAAPAALKAPSNVVVVAAPFAQHSNAAVKAFMGMLVNTESFMKQKKNLPKVESIVSKNLLAGAPQAEVASVLSAIPHLYSSVCWTPAQFNASHTLLKDLNLLTKTVTYAQLIDKAGEAKGC
jgi:ABC-type nitrate/sulfonate/bicarbonate transport system substrate-binding protein